MTTKTKTNKPTRGRPKKDFSNVKIKKQDTSVKRPRGRPRKENKPKEILNKNIIKHSDDIKALSKRNEKIQLEVKNTSFSSRKVWENKRSDNFALILLIVSMLFFIFSLYRTYYFNKDTNTQIVQNRIISQQNNYDEFEIERNDKQIPDNIVLENENIVKDEIIYDEKVKIEPEVKEELNDYEIINDFYNTINDKDFSKLNDFVDRHLRSSNVYKTYYSKNWLTRFTEKLANKKVYLTDIQETSLEDKKNWISYYSYILKYKLNNSNELFREEREASIVTRWDKKLIWSLRCVTVWCSKMPFFNLPRYEK